MRSFRPSAGCFWCHTCLRVTHQPACGAGSVPLVAGYKYSVSATTYKTPASSHPHVSAGSVVTDALCGALAHTAVESFVAWLTTTVLIAQLFLVGAHIMSTASPSRLLLAHHGSSHPYKGVAAAFC